MLRRSAIWKICRAAFFYCELINCRQICLDKFLDRSDRDQNAATFRLSYLDEIELPLFPEIPDTR